MTDLGSIVTGAANTYGQDPNALLREAQIESSMNPNARNASGAAGLFQFMPKTGAAAALAAWRRAQITGSGRLGALFG